MHPKQILAVTEHRPHPLPSGPWMMRQSWHDLLFAHWPLETEHVRAAMPAELRPHLDTFDGKAWVGVIPFWMSGVRTRGLPLIPTTSTFPELNVRTYVTIAGKPGVYFFSLDAASLLAVLGAKAGFALRYFWAKMRCDVSGERVQYSSRRNHSPTPAEFAGEYRAAGEARTSEAGSFEHFAIDRYCLYAARGAHVLRGDIHHLPWRLQPAEARIGTNTVARASGIRLPDSAPMLHFAKAMDVLVWWPEQVEP